jgi:diguanylate cyclase (GGDEF)-like protein/PAS domain S-box-containing protein
MSTQTPLTDEQCFRALMENTVDSIYFKDRKCRLVRVSQMMADTLGVSDPQELYGKTDIELFGEEFGRRTLMDDTKVMQTGEPIVGLVESRRLESGQLNWTLTSKLPIRDEDGTVIGLMGITREINELKQTELNLQHLATHDFLTDLPNRFLMNDRLEQIMARAERSSLDFAVIYMDLNNFKSVNDTYGHEVGDMLLCQVAQRLKSVVRATDTVARIGGDEFMIILAALHQREDVTIVADKVQACFANPFSVGQHQIKMQASIGISLYPEHGEDEETLVKAADYAMYLSKRRSGRYVLCPKDKLTFGDETQPE